MDSTPVKEVFDHLYSLLETLETQNTAILRFLQDEGVATEEKLAPYLEQAGNASSVKWRAARARMEHLFAPAPKKATEQVPTPKKADAQQPGMQDGGGAKAANPAKDEQDGKLQGGVKAHGNTDAEVSAKHEASKNANDDQPTHGTNEEKKQDAKAPDVNATMNG